MLAQSLHQVAAYPLACRGDMSSRYQVRSVHAGVATALHALLLRAATTRAASATTPARPRTPFRPVLSPCRATSLLNVDVNANPPALERNGTARRLLVARSAPCPEPGGSRQGPGRAPGVTGPEPGLGLGHAATPRPTPTGRGRDCIRGQQRLAESLCKLSYPNRRVTNLI